MPIAGHENLIVQNIDTLAYDGASPLNYWTVYAEVPPQTLHSFVPNGERWLKQLAKITFSAAIVNATNNVITSGFLDAQLILISGQGNDGIRHPPPFAWHGVIPVLRQGTILGVESYDPVALTIGGTNQGVWTRHAIDPLETNWYMNPDYNPGGYTLLCLADLQINGSSADPNALTVQTWIQWEMIK